MVWQNPVDDRLGRLLSSHPVATSRYWSTGGLALAVGVAGGLVIASVIAVPDLAGGKIMALALIPAFVGFPVAAVQLLRALRRGGNQAFELYENGLAVVTATDRHTWRWEQIAVLRANPEAAEAPPAVPLDRLLHALGWNFGCSFRPLGGSPIRIDGYTRHGSLIAKALLAHCPAPLATARRAWVTLGASFLAVVAFGTPLVLLYRHLNGTSSADIADSMLVIEALAMIVCIVGLFLSLTDARDDARGDHQE